MFEKYRLKKAMRIAEKKIERGEIKVRSLEDALNQTNDDNETNIKYDVQNKPQQDKPKKSFGKNLANILLSNYTLGTMWAGIGMLNYHAAMQKPEFATENYWIIGLNFTAAGLFYFSGILNTTFKRKINQYNKKNNY
ncbi:hypothetical protein HOK51_05285 [Candidatus Woesearchaeota archaeon]|jgi:hypothetical protein|nr:hypothetical protein [Candidatus Woesearchaeota archaeon]MBT6519241.1 hypothetical protein [Candidatus Woesearchaeota archaeon]MBT7366774.1 hypothetical protein [Candidatus Woesearchaeota archaeon]